MFVKEKGFIAQTFKETGFFYIPNILVASATRTLFRGDLALAWARCKYDKVMMNRVGWAIIGCVHCLVTVATVTLTNNKEEWTHFSDYNHTQGTEGT